MGELWSLVSDTSKLFVHIYFNDLENNKTSKLKGQFIPYFLFQISSGV